MEIIKSQKTALVVGATGMVGRQLVIALLKHHAYKEVVTFGRRDLDLHHDRLKHHILDFRRLPDYKSLFEGHDLFLSIGTTRAKAGSKEAFLRVDYDYPLKIAQLASVQQVLLVSSAGADPDSLLFYLQVKGQLEHALAQLPLWGLHVFRPSFLEGDRKEFRLGEEIGTRLLRGADFLSGGRAVPPRLKLVEDVTLARAMIVVAQGLKPGLRIYENEALPGLAAKWKGNSPKKT